MPGSAIHVRLGRGELEADYRSKVDHDWIHQKRLVRPPLTPRLKRGHAKDASSAVPGSATHVRLGRGELDADYRSAPNW